MFCTIAKLQLNTVHQAKRWIITSARDTVKAPAPTGLKTFDDKIVESTLPSGVRVFSVDTPSPLNTFSVFVNAGSRYETSQTEGSAHFLKYLGFKGTNNKSALRLIRDLEHIGASYFTNISRDTVSYHFQGLRDVDETGLSILTETMRFVLNPTLSEYEFETVRENVMVECNERSECPENILSERMHAEAFLDTGLGRPLITPAHSVNNLSPLGVFQHIKDFYYPGSRVVIVGTGIEHKKLLDRLNPLFGNFALEGGFRELRDYEPLPSVTPTSQSNNYTGGSTIRLPTLSETHIVLAFPGLSHTHNDTPALTVLKKILGSHASSKHGPGDATRESRLYNGVEEAENWVLSANAFQMSYQDTGLFGVHASAKSGHAAQLFQLVWNQVKSLDKVTEEELTRAKNVVKAKHLRYLDSDPFALHQNISDGVFSGKLISSQEFLNAIDRVSLQDIKRVVSNILQSKPILVGTGDVSGLPRI